MALERPERSEGEKVVPARERRNAGPLPDAICPQRETRPSPKLDWDAHVGLPTTDENSLNRLPFL